MADRGTQKPIDRPLPAGPVNMHKVRASGKTVAESVSKAQSSPPGPVSKR